MITGSVREAAADLRWLLNHGYPKNASVKLVGDRHRLSKSGRQILYRGVVPDSDAGRRRSLLLGTDKLVMKRLAVDGHNVVLTVANFLIGVPVFKSDDGLLRDIGSVHGRLHEPELMNRSLDLVADYLGALRLDSLIMAFDAPLSHSRDHAGRVRARLLEIVGNHPDKVKVVVADSADQAVKAARPDVLASSDSAVIDALGVPVFDLARYVLEREFTAEFESLE